MAVLGLDGLATGAGKMWRDAEGDKGGRERNSESPRERRRESQRDPRKKDRDTWRLWQGQRQITEDRKGERQSSIETERGREERREINTGKKREEGSERGMHRKGTGRQSPPV